MKKVFKLLYEAPDTRLMRGCVQGNFMTNPIYDKLLLERARRTAFISRFIVLREGKKSKAHRQIETLEWTDATTTEELYVMLRDVFSQYGDSPITVERDLRRAKAHADRLNPYKNDGQSDTFESHFSLWPLIEEYNKRACTNFVDALFDYERSNKLLFGDEGDQPKLGGWRLPRELLRGRKKGAEKSAPKAKQSRKSVTEHETVSQTQH